MGSTRRAILAIAIGAGVLKLGGKAANTESENNNDSQLIEENNRDQTSEKVLYHEKQNVYLQPGEAFAEVFESSGRNKLRLRTPDFPTMEGHVGIYTYEEWLSLKRGIEEQDDWEAGEPIETLPIDPKRSTYEFQLPSGGKYAIVFGLRQNGLGSTEAQNVGFEYWVYD